MRAVRYHEPGGPDVLGVEDVPEPTPTPTELLVETRAIGLNPTEVYSREGARDHPLPRILGADFAGVVEAVGESVDGYQVGDRVFGTGLQTHRQGSYAEYVVTPEHKVASLPEGVSFETGAAVGVVGTTAWLAFLEHASLTPTSTCLIHGGSGGVGHAAIQVASACGATVIATAGSERTRDFCEEKGADIVLDYDNPDLDRAVLGAAGGPVDIVLDHRVGDYLQFDVDVLATGGTVLVVGGPGDEATLSDIWAGLRADARIQIFSISNHPRLAEPLEAVATLLADGRLDIHIERRYEMEAAGEAQRAMMTESFPGKLLLLP